MRRTPLIPVVAAALALLSTTVAPAANAVPVEDELATGLVTPLSVAVADDGTVYTSQNFAGLLTRIAPGAEPEVIYADEGGREVGAVSVAGDVVTFATTGGDPVSADLYTYTETDEGWEQTHVADLWAHEQATNADGGTGYGIKGLKKSCKKEFKKRDRWLFAYKGIQESHPYATTSMGPTTFVADAAANAILAVTGGEVSTVATLPATNITLTKKIRKGLGLPKCAQGKVFRAEAVPTDIEAGPGGALYVTSLPGGPEDPVMGANGRVYVVNPATGDVVQAATGLVSPTGLAIEPDGTAYVSMLFAGVVMKQDLGAEPEVFAPVAGGPGDVEIGPDGVYGTDTGLMSETGNGRVLRWTE